MNKPELHYYELASNVVAFSSTRYGGVSKGNYAAFNINKYCGDVPEDIEQNRRNLANSLGIDIDKLIVPHQIHGDCSQIIAHEYFSLPANIREQIIEGDEVYEQFANAQFDMERIAKRFRVLQTKEGELPLKWHLDLKLSNRIDMETLGILPQNIIDEKICTYDNTSDYFSARKLGINSGRIYNGIILR